jgi:O-antigen/teichoic acid export membrane protein
LGPSSGDVPTSVAPSPYWGRTKLNLLASFVGTGWAALIQIVFIPVYIRLMGIEAYGLIGFYFMTQGVLQILDFGLSPTVNRELSRYSTQGKSGNESRDLVRTLEVGYWIIGGVIGLAMLSLAPFIALHWIHATSITNETILRAVLCMTVLATLQWPLSFYQAGLMGLQRQVALNTISVALSTLRGGGAVLLLLFVSPTIIAFFFWQIVVTAVQVALTTIVLWRSLPSGDRPARFDRALLRSVAGFAAGMSGITISGLVLIQLDKVILSRLLNLKLFGYYTLASLVAGSLAVIITPMFNTLFPRLSALVAARDEVGIRRCYHRFSQLTAVLIIPIATVVSVFAFDILLLWTGNAETAMSTAPIVKVLILGTALNGLMHLPYALQLAYGWTSIGLRINAFLIAFLVPAIYYMTVHYGPIGAAACWLALHVIYMAVGVPLTHGRVLKGETRRWFLEDIGPSVLAVAVVTLIGRSVLTASMAPKDVIIRLVAISVCALGSAALLTPDMRTWALKRAQGSL